MTQPILSEERIIEWINAERGLVQAPSAPAIRRKLLRRLEMSVNNTNMELADKLIEELCDAKKIKIEWRLDLGAYTMSFVKRRPRRSRTT